jgi:hypothetical protein
MDRPRISLALGAAAGALLGVTFLPAGAAFADTYDIVPDPNSTELVSTYYGLYSALPALDASALGYQTFDVDDTTLGTVVGKFEGYEATTSGVFFGSNNQEILVTSVLSGTTGTATGDVPPVGSVLDTFMFGDTGFGAVYSAIPSTSGVDTISNTFITPFGDYTTPLVFDAAAIPIAELAKLVTQDYGFVPISGNDVTAVSGIPPFAVAEPGPQEFATAAGTFDAETVKTWDFAGNATEAILVTSTTGTTGTAAGEVPPVGSTFNIITFDLPGYQLVYSDLIPVTPGGADTVTETLVTPYGDYNIPETYDLSAILAAGGGTVALGDDYEIRPASAEVLSGINGVPPLDGVIQGYQQFAVDNAALGTVAGTFNADVSSALDSYGEIDRTILVTSDLSGTPGTAAGDVPPVGSVFDTFTFGDTGIENIYIDLASTAAGGDVISDTLVTPFGDFIIPATVDLSAALASVTFLGP